MPFSALLPTSQQLVSLRAFAQHDGQGKSADKSRNPFRSCRAETQQKPRSQDLNQLQTALYSKQTATQLSRRDTIVATLLALQIPAILPGEAAHALG